MLKLQTRVYTVILFSTGLGLLLGKNFESALCGFCIGLAWACLLPE